VARHSSTNDGLAVCRRGEPPGFIHPCPGSVVPLDHEYLAGRRVADD
jgi:hypothetical protein